METRLNVVLYEFSEFILNQFNQNWVNRMKHFGIERKFPKKTKPQDNCYKSYNCLEKLCTTILIG